MNVDRTGKQEDAPSASRKHATHTKETHMPLIATPPPLFPGTDEDKRFYSMALVPGTKAVWVPSCDECGALVLHTGRHADWHAGQPEGAQS